MTEHELLLAWANAAKDMLKFRSVDWVDASVLRTLIKQTEETLQMLTR